MMDVLNHEPSGGSTPGYVNVSIANVYTDATFRSEICTQAVLWERVSVREQRNGFVEVGCEDGYPGWIDEQQVVTAIQAPRDLRMMSRMRGVIVDSCDKTVPVDCVWAGGYLDVVSETGGSLLIRLPDGRTGSIEAQLSGPITGARPADLVMVARRFLGVPYYWGGKTPAGCDCSGFVQLVHKLCGMAIRRDASDQYDEATHRADDPLASEPGDLLFFSGDGKRVTHVGICLGDGLVIHSRGMVRLDSVDRTDDRFRRALIDTFVAVRSYF